MAASCLRRTLAPGVLAAALGLGGLACGPPTEEELRAAAARFGPRPVVDEEDGGVAEVERALRAAAREPNAVDVEDCTLPTPHEDGWRTSCGYWARNEHGQRRRSAGLCVIRYGRARELHAGDAPRPGPPAASAGPPGEASLGPAPAVRASDGRIGVVERYLRRLADYRVPIFVEGCTEPVAEPDGWHTRCEYYTRDVRGVEDRQAAEFVVRHSMVTGHTER